MSHSNRETSISYITTFFPSAILAVYPENKVSIKILDLKDKLWLKNNNSDTIAFLNEEEKNWYNDYTFAKRAEEWLAGRICAKLAVKEFPAFSALAPQNITIINDGTGRPYVSLIQGTSSGKPAGLDISISHSKTMACAMAADSYCGIDIQAKTNTLVKVADKYCLWQEKTLLEKHLVNDSHRALNLLWCSKEAIRKTCSHSFIPGFLELQLCHIDRLAETFLFSFTYAKDTRTRRVLCTAYNNYGLAICVDKGDIHA
ncbi:MAG: hypothetical protein CSA26_10985 [Desulfobacterales bacterium]|nr:MAG: hypothetical protein CSA26_10985 [Desulfobacterales bacterium]